MKNKDFNQVCLSEFTARFCVWAVISQLLVHLIHIHWKTASAQLYIVGISISMLYISAIFGGIIRDYLFDGRPVIMFGVGLIGVGSFLLFPQFELFYLGLGLLLLGAGMVTPNTPLLLSSFSDVDREKPFTILYGVTNAGVILGSILGGFLEVYFSWEGMLILNEVIIALWFCGCILNGWLVYLKKIDKIKLVQFAGMFFLAGAITYFYLTIKSVSEILLIIVGLVYLGFILFLMIKNTPVRKRLGFIIFLTALIIIFFSGEFQVASTLVDYANNFVKLNIMHIKIPPGSLLAFESIFVVLGAFIIARVKWLSALVHIQVKVCVGLLLGALAFTVLYVSHFSAAHHSISVLWIIFAFLLLGFGDVYLMPPVMAYVANHSPLKYKGRLMAGMYFSISLSGYFSGLIASELSKYFVAPSANLHFYSRGFEIMILILVAAAVFLFAISIIKMTVYPRN